MRVWHLSHLRKNAPLNAHADVSSGVRGLNVSNLHLHPNFVYASCKNTGDSAQSRQIFRARCSTL